MTFLLRSEIEDSTRFGRYETWARVVHSCDWSFKYRQTGSRQALTVSWEEWKRQDASQEGTHLSGQALQLLIVGFISNARLRRADSISLPPGSVRL